MRIDCTSLLSGLTGDAQVGGFSPAKPKVARFDAIVVKGNVDLLGLPRDQDRANSMSPMMP
jgi:hypothetical protein